MNSREEKVYEHTPGDSNLLKAIGQIEPVAVGVFTSSDEGEVNMIDDEDCCVVAVVDIIVDGVVLCCVEGDVEN